jgi:hypothetical protein
MQFPPLAGPKGYLQAEEIRPDLREEEKTSIEVLCHGLPQEFVVYARSLGFDDEPDYDYLRNIFREDYVFD